MSLQTRITAALQAIGLDMKSALSRALISFFQVRDNGGAGQLTTDTATTLSSIWSTPEITSAEFTFAAGVLTVNSGGILELDVAVHSWNNLNNRHELHAQIQKDGGGGYVTLMEVSNYASRNNTQDEGGVVISGFKNAVNAGDAFRVRVFDIGVAAIVGQANTSGQTYISAKLYQ